MGTDGRTDGQIDRKETRVGLRNFSNTPKTAAKINSFTYNVKTQAIRD
jgi:hypothetical protein